ncbi:unnamed protein product [Pieris brassicae]|uniref:Uncharacterized protein n=1 Tax=Pieris brassicae TaxID=7116 RepID=A0A9P0SG17_PIEBR|nr:unnamed protein product [Pieris brassicae]CAH3820425.1 unnamed protein product [Pieris brassicae]
MFSKVIAFGAFLAAAKAGLHGQAVSSQSIVRHDTGYGSAAYAPLAYGGHYGSSHYDGHDTYIQRSSTQLRALSSPPARLPPPLLSYPQSSYKMTVK